MTINQMDQLHAELEYIDSMLNVEGHHDYVKNECTKKATEAVYENSAHSNVYQLFTVSGITFAVVQSDIEMVVRCDDVVNQDGLVEHAGKMFHVNNIKQYFGSNNRQDDEEFYILLVKKQLAIPCDEIMSVENIDNASICWRNENSDRKWLLGTSIFNDVAILNPAELNNL